MPHKKPSAAPFREEAMLPIDMLTVAEKSGEVLGKDGSKGMVFSHYFSKPGVHPFDEIEWERREAVISDASGKTIFKQTGVEVPKFWSQLATNVVVSKYFHGKVNTPERETSVKQLVNRVSRTIADWGIKDGYFASREEGERFYRELTYLLVNQYAAFNSPVWFNVGIEPHPQCSACFINSVEDTMESILELAKIEGMLFKYGSGTGTNFSTLRSSKESLSGGGIASGPVSFMKGFDAFAGVIKSGGRTRRAAKMVILNADHPDIEEFINCKAKEEKKAWTLLDAGYDGSIDGEAYGSIFFQNANHSVRATDAFMEAVEQDKKWTTRAVTTGEAMDTYRARDLMRMIAESTHICGDPGMQFDTTINDWHTCPNSARINGSNPCVTGDTLVATENGLRRIDSMLNETPRVVGLDGRLHRAAHVIETGVKPVYRLRTRSGYEIKLTADHRVWTENRGDIPAAELTKDDVVRLIPPYFGKETLDSEVAEYIGLMLGDGCVSGEVATLAMNKELEYRVAEKAAEVVNRFSRHRGTVQPTERETSIAVATNAAAVRELLNTYTVLDEGSAAKRLTDQAFQLNRFAIAALLRGLFTAEGSVADYGEKSQYIALDSTSEHLLHQVQLLLLAFGIKSKLYRNRRLTDHTLLPDGQGGLKEYPVQQIHSLRISRSSRFVFEKEIGIMPESYKAEALRSLNSRVDSYQDSMTDRVASLELLGEEPVYDLTEPQTDHFVAGGIAVHNCSEYMFIDNTACNLASFNLLKFVDAKGNFQVEDYRAATRVMITAMEILVDNSSYPRKEIAENSHLFRTLGLGYANLGALLMSMGLPYDSDEGRAYAAAVTSLLCGQAYLTSAELAGVAGPFKEFEKNRAPMLRVIDKHRAASHKINPAHVPEKLLAAATSVWDEAYQLGEQNGYRNAQVTVLAPTGTIAFMMDCDTTGVEPDIALVKYKKLVGGGMLKIVNHTVTPALRKLGYSEQAINRIVTYIDENDTIEGAPELKEEHLSVFDCAFKPVNGVRSIHYMGHVKMLAATQPFISGAISKTVNVPENITVDEIMDIYIRAWKMGIKAIAIYRDNSKRTQPLSTVKETVKEYGRPYRRRLPDERQAITHKFSIGGHEGYITVGMYEDGSPGEIFIVMAKEGSIVSGLMDSFATAISLALQYGVPLKVLINKFTHTRFEPSGFTNNPQIPMAKSILDYIFRWLALKFLPKEEKALYVSVGAGESEAKTIELPFGGGEPENHSPEKTNGAKTLEEREKFVYQMQADAPYCPDCGAIMYRNGSCYKCNECGATSGCS